MVHNFTKLMEWETEEFTYRKKSNDWYWGLSVIVVAGIVVAFFDKNFLLGVFVILAGTLVFFFAQKKPDTVSAEVSDQGIKINSDFFPYHNIDSFWISEENNEWKLLLHIHRSLNQLVAVPLHKDMEPEALREILLDYVAELEKTEPLSHKMSDKIGF